MKLHILKLSSLLILVGSSCRSEHQSARDDGDAGSGSGPSGTNSGGGTSSTGGTGAGGAGDAGEGPGGGTSAGGDWIGLGGAQLEGSGGLGSGGSGSGSGSAPTGLEPGACGVTQRLAVDFPDSVFVPELGFARRVGGGLAVGPWNESPGMRWASFASLSTTAVYRDAKYTLQDKNAPVILQDAHRVVLSGMGPSLFFIGSGEDAVTVGPGGIPGSDPEAEVAWRKARVMTTSSLDESRGALLYKPNSSDGMISLFTEAGEFVGTPVPWTDGECHGVLPTSDGAVFFRRDADGLRLVQLRADGATALSVVVPMEGDSSACPALAPTEDGFAALDATKTLHFVSTDGKISAEPWEEAPAAVRAFSIIDESPVAVAQDEGGLLVRRTPSGTVALPFDLGQRTWQIHSEPGTLWLGVESRAGSNKPELELVEIRCDGGS